MRFMCKIAALACAFLGLQADANAQAVCPIIFGYFGNAPSRFIAERGQRLGEGYWRKQPAGPEFVLLYKGKQEPRT